MLFCKAILKTGKNKGNRCACKANKLYGKYCGNHKNYDSLKNEIEKKPKHKKIILPENIINLIHRYIDKTNNFNKLDIDKPNNSNKLDINDPNNLKYFWEKCKKCENDRTNKYREKILEKIINNKDFYKIFENKKFKNRYSSLVQNLKREISSYCSEKFDKIEAKQKGGRSSNFDLLLTFSKNNKDIKSVKVEFKYGVNTITKYPEIYSKYINNCNIFLEKSYIERYFNDIDKFIATFPKNISEKLKTNKPLSLDNYNINDTNYKHIFQNTIYNFSKKHNGNKKIEFRKFINEQIKNFLKNIEISDINFTLIQELISDKQKDKNFLLCNDGSFVSEKIDDFITMTEEVRLNKSGNTLVFPCTNNQYELHWLLRWKNHHGCSGPAWQVKLHKVFQKS